MTTHSMLRRGVAGVALTAAAIAGAGFAASAASGAATPATAAAQTALSPVQPEPMGRAAARLPGSEPAGVTATVPSNSPLVAEVAAWVAKGGEKQLTTLGFDFGVLEKAANATDMTAMGAGCDQLRKDVESAQAYAPIPDASAQREWAGALAAYARGAVDCVDGAGTANVDLITQAANQIMAGSADLDKVTARLNQIAGH